MSTPPIQGTTLTIATVNDDWASAGSNLGMVLDVRDINSKAAAPVVDCDVVMIQEGKRAKYTDLVGKSRVVHQDTSSQAKAGSVLIWRKGGSIKATGSGWTFLVRAVGLLARYLAWGRFDVVAEAAIGRELFLGSDHRPPRRTASWWNIHDAALAARCRRARRTGRLVIIGMDANQAHPEKLAKMCRLVWHSVAGRTIDGFLASPQILFTDIHELPKGTSDHHPLVATVVIPQKRVKKPKPVKSPPPFDRVVYNGRLMDNKTKAFVQAMEKRLGFPLTILQGCYNGGAGAVAASAGTHDGGGVIDFAPFDWEHKVRVAKVLGGFPWHRPFNWDHDGGGEHIHCGIRNHGRLSPSAQSQQVQYDAHPPTNGLASHGADAQPWRPSPPVVFQYPKHL